MSVSKCYMVQSVPPSRAGMSKLWTTDQKQRCNFFYRCTMHLDNVRVPFYQQMHLLLSI